MNTTLSEIMQSARAEKEESRRLTATELRDVIAAENTGVNRGRVLHYLTQARETPHPPEVVDFLQALHAAAVQAATASTPYRHPRDTVRPIKTEAHPLTAVDVAWLNALPADPAQISFGDACQLAAMAAAEPDGKATGFGKVSDGYTPADRRLIEQRWKPVEDAYDRRAAEHTLTASKSPVTLPNPTSALSALIAEETTELSASECSLRALEMAETAKAEMDSRLERTLAAAQQTIADIDQRATARTATEAPA